MLHFGLPAADIIADPTQPFALSHLHAGGGVDQRFYPPAAPIFWSLGGICAVLRYLLDAHWPSDVLGAYMLGSLWLTLTVFVYLKGKTRFFAGK